MSTTHSTKGGAELFTQLGGFGGFAVAPWELYTSVMSHRYPFPRLMAQRLWRRRRVLRTRRGRRCPCRPRSAR